MHLNYHMCTHIALDEGMHSTLDHIESLDETQISMKHPLTSHEHKLSNVNHKMNPLRMRVPDNPEQLSNHLL